MVGGMRVGVVEEWGIVGVGGVVDDWVDGGLGFRGWGRGVNIEIVVGVMDEEGGGGGVKGEVER